jgi:hypothetical protein
MQQDAGSHGVTDVRAVTSRRDDRSGDAEQIVVEHR